MNLRRWKKEDIYLYEQMKGYKKLLTILFFVIILSFVTSVTSSITSPLLLPLLLSPTHIVSAQNGVLCRAQYSASLGGRNEGLPNVSITTTLVGAKIQTPIVFITDEHGQTYIPFKSKEKYDITVVYKDVEKIVRLSYNGESVLLISIDPNKPFIGDIVFLQPQPSDEENVLTIGNLGWFALGAVVSFIIVTFYHRWRGN